MLTFPTITFLENKRNKHGPSPTSLNSCLIPSGGIERRLVDPTSSSASISSFQLTDASAYKADGTTPPHFDIFTTTDTTYDNLASSHLGRFSRFLMGPTIAMPALQNQSGDRG